MNDAHRIVGKTVAEVLLARGPFDDQLVCIVFTDGSRLDLEAAESCDERYIDCEFTDMVVNKVK